MAIQCTTRVQAQQLLFETASKARFFASELHTVKKVCSIYVAFKCSDEPDNKDTESIAIAVNVRDGVVKIMDLRTGSVSHHV